MEICATCKNEIIVTDAISSARNWSVSGCRVCCEKCLREMFAKRGRTLEEEIENKKRRANSTVEYCQYCGQRATSHDFYGAAICDGCR